MCPTVWDIRVHVCIWMPVMAKQTCRSIGSSNDGMNSVGHVGRTSIFFVFLFPDHPRSRYLDRKLSSRLHTDSCRVLHFKMDMMPNCLKRVRKVKGLDSGWIMPNHAIYGCIMMYLHPGNWSIQVWSQKCFDFHCDFYVLGIWEMAMASMEFLRGNCCIG